MIQIGIVGAGGVGAYYGGLLAEYYKHSSELNIIFVCKESYAHVIDQKGLRLETTHGNYHLYPRTFHKEKFEGHFDYVLSCTKAFDLLEGLESIQGFISYNTIIIPLQNGIDHYQKIKDNFPNAEVWDACVYLVAQIAGAGHILETGGLQSLRFGNRFGNGERENYLENIFIKAGINARLSDHIMQTIWEKFAFISPVATMTSYIDGSIGQILDKKENMEIFHRLLIELIKLAEHKQINLPLDMYELVIERMRKLPYDTSSSMHRDFQKGKQTEIETLTGSVLQMAAESGLLTPQYQHCYNELQSRIIK